ncbi:DUF1707 domain-containing protein [Kribbella sandramycini]|uniref:DUF1707 domain-containing protein n=1 Tax=Kribbella sandramycini TaxID=60450 RepID=A0A7Y4L6T8_9ACTN|nr:DUF1707 domain-containing protein [Kribbella sandramycini]MBB6571738.1 hypothetical protein [Kribbella sandramycini]NOL44381.1 DUF1707 domain-containing protein [Kribbella sandramycini]
MSPHPRRDRYRYDAGPEWPKLVRPEPKRRVRIGDVERDRAVEALSEHFVAGRLTQEEFEERSGQATRARWSDELNGLFDDLPTAGEVQLARRETSMQKLVAPSPLFFLAPVLMVGLVVTAVTLTAPWLLWGIFWIALFSGVNRRRYHHYRQ